MLLKKKKIQELMDVLIPFAVEFSVSKTTCKKVNISELFQYGNG